MSILNRALAYRRASPFGQFGQANTSLSSNGATGCTDTCLQFLTRLVKGVSYSHNQIRQKVGHRNPLTGLNSTEVGAWFRAMGLPWVVKFNLTADQMLSLSRSRGPVLVAEIYGYHPIWRGYRGAPAHPVNGVARPVGAAGRNQFNWSGRHAIVLIGYTDLNTVYVMEPNHVSGGRPQQVAYDVITVAQFRALVAAWKRSTGNTYCAVPTKTLS
jgi:hypothetical protein